MAKRKSKGGRSGPKGGRVTPKGARPDGSRNLWAVPPMAPPPPSPEDELRETLEDCLEVDHPLAMLELVSTMIWVGAHPGEELRRSAPQLLASEAEQSLVDALPSFGVAGLTALAAVGRLATSAPARDQAKRGAHANRALLPAWCSELDDTVGVRSVVLSSSDEHGTSDEIAIEFHLGSHVLSLLALIDTNGEPLLADGMVVPVGIDEVMASTDRPARAHNDLLLGDARARIVDALAMNDRYQAAFETDSWPEQRPLAEWLLGLLPEGGTGYPEPRGRVWSHSPAARSSASEDLFGGFDPAQAALLVAQQLERQVGGPEALAALDDAPLPDEPFDWTGIPEDIHDRVAEVLTECESFAAAHFDVEMRTAVRRLLADIAAHGPVAFRRSGAAWSAAAGICFVVGEANGVVQPWSQDPGVMNASEVAAHWGRKGAIRQRGEALLRAASISARLPPRYLCGSQRAQLVQLRDALPDLADLFTSRVGASASSSAALERRELAEPTAHVVKVTINGSKPPIWRRLVVPSQATLAELHEILQVAFEWGGYHLHEFRVGQMRFAPPNEWDDPAFGPPTEDDASVCVGELVTEGDRLVYTYDFGDDWEHRIDVEEVRLLDRWAPHGTCIAGRRAAPPEDIGGIWMFNDLVSGGPIDPGYEGWLPTHFDPKEFDAEDITDLLSDLPEIQPPR